MGTLLEEPASHRKPGEGPGTSLPQSLRRTTADFRLLELKVRFCCSRDQGCGSRVRPQGTVQGPFSSHGIYLSLLSPKPPGTFQKGFRSLQRPLCKHRPSRHSV